MLRKLSDNCVGQFLLDSKNATCSNQVLVIVWSFFFLLFKAFKEMMSDLKNPNKKKEKAKKSKGQDGPILAQISTLQPSRTSRAASVTSDIDAFDGKPKKGAYLYNSILPIFFYSFHV